MSLEREAVASATIELLEARLRRLEYLLTGETRWGGEPTPPPRPDSLDHTVARRLARLEEDLEALSARKPVVQDVLQLRTSIYLSIYNLQTLIEDLNRRAIP